MKVAIFTPLNPIRSGISDYVENLALSVKESLEIDFFVDGYEAANEEIREQFHIYQMDQIESEELRKTYDLLWYQIGNNAEHHGKIFHYAEKYPGVLELHDFSLHNYVAATTVAQGKQDIYLNMLEYCHGQKGRQVGLEFINQCIPAPWEEQALQYPTNKYWIDKSLGVIVHSDFAKQMVRGMAPEKAVVHVPLYVKDNLSIIAGDKKTCRETLGIPDEKTVLGSFGFATRAKGNSQILEALAEIKEQGKDFVFYIAGDMQDEEVPVMIQKYGLEKQVVVTGYVTEKDFLTVMNSCDICLNLRYPTCGETSATLHTMLGLGKAVVVTDVGSFSDYPCVKKVSRDMNREDLAEAILELMENKELRNSMEKAAKTFAEENLNKEQSAELYIRFFDSLIKDEKRETDYWDSFVDKLMDLYLVEESYVNRISERVSSLLNESL